MQSPPCRARRASSHCRRLFAALLALSCWLAPRVGAAQRTCSPEEERSAREMFERGLATLVGDSAIARDLFESSLARCPRAPAAFNLALALRQSGEVSSSLALLDALLDEDYGPLESAQRTACEGTRDLTRGDLAWLEVELGPGEVSAPQDLVLQIDGEVVESFATGTVTRISVDPGRHELVLRAECASGAAQHVTLERGGTQHVVLAANLLADAALCSHAPTPSIEPASGGGVDGVAIGLGVGAGILVLAGAITLIVWATQPAGEATCRGEPCVIALRAPLLSF